MKQQEAIFAGLQQMNNDAISLLLEGEPEASIAHLFQCASGVQSLVMTLAEPSPQANNTNTHDDAAAAASSTTHISLEEVSLDQVIYAFDASERVSPENCFRLHRCVYMVHNNHGGCGGNPDDALYSSWQLRRHISTVRTLFATVMYNIAAITHESVQAGIQPHLLDRARCMYELALAALFAGDTINNEYHHHHQPYCHACHRAKSPSSPSPSCGSPSIFHGDSLRQLDTGSSSCLALRLALVNNLGHIHAVFNNRDGAFLCLHQLNSLLTSTTSSSSKLNLLSGSSFRPVSGIAVARNHMSKAPAA